MTRRRSIFAGCAGACAVATSLAACGSDLGGALQAGSITKYEPSSAFAPTGHHVATLPDGRYRITATGSSITPKARVEKIAMARAAEFGVEGKHKFFQASAPQVSIRCGDRTYVQKGETRQMPARGYPVVEIDVAYANTPTDATFRSTKVTSSELQADLQSEVVAQDASMAIASEVKAQCGG